MSAMSYLCCGYFKKPFYHDKILFEAAVKVKCVLTTDTHIVPMSNIPTRMKSPSCFAQGSDRVSFMTVQLSLEIPANHTTRTIPFIANTMCREKTVVFLFVYSDCC